MDANQRTQSPRAALHVKLTETSSHEQAGGGLPTSHGRRIMQMIFRSNNEDESRQAQREAMVLTSPVVLHADSRSEDEAPVGSNRLSALKRKLFPSRKRRHPVRIPPLVISPINTENPLELPTGDSTSNQEVGPEPTEPDLVDFERNEDSVHFNTEDDGDIDDDLLEAIEAADRLQSTTSDETLAEMNRVIDELQKWKIEHDRATHIARDQTEQNLHREEQSTPTSVEDDAIQSNLLEEAERNHQVAAAATAKLQLAIKLAGDSIAERKRGDEHVNRVLMQAERQSVNDAANQTDTQAIQMQKLRGEVFDLEVKELSSSLHQSYLCDLEGADDELDMKLVEVEAFASELDSVLAQFDAAQSAFRETEQNPAGQVAREH